VFDEATVRAAATPGSPLADHLLRWRGSPAGPRTLLGGVSPHALRHTAAVNWLVELVLENQRRAAGAPPAGTAAHLPGTGVFDPMFYVRGWLRHVDESTTRLYQTWVHRQDWPQTHALGQGVVALVEDDGQ